jgi:methylenetetrahydrofolate dehydrogenase (NADP+)/methenyltetrahydrofolate cyclohydrolase
MTPTEARRVATIVNGSALSLEICEQLGQSFAELIGRSGVIPSLAIVQPEGDDAAAVYTRRLRRTFTNAGVEVTVHQLRAQAPPGDAPRLIATLSADPAVHAIQILTPLPPNVQLGDLLTELDPDKDVDGIHPQNTGLLAQGRPGLAPATPLGGMEILRRHQVPIAGARAVVVGRSPTVGRPMALLLIQQDATVTVCHSRTQSLGAIIGEAEILAVAAGRPGLVTAEMIRPGATVIDFGTTVVDDKLVGDVDPAAADRASLITPVPGGTGPVTNAMLLRNALTIYRRAIGVETP